MFYFVYIWMECDALCDTCVRVYAGEHTSVHMFTEEGGCCSITPVSLILLRQNKLSQLSLLELGWWPSSPSNPPVEGNPAFPTVLGPSHMWPHLPFYGGVRDSNSGLHALAASLLALRHFSSLQITALQKEFTPGKIVLTQSETNYTRKERTYPAGVTADGLEGNKRHAPYTKRHWRKKKVVSWCLGTRIGDHSKVVLTAYPEHCGWIWTITTQEMSKQLGRHEERERWLS